MEPKVKTAFPLSSASWSSKCDIFTLNGNQERPNDEKNLKIPNVLIMRAKLQLKTVNLRTSLSIKQITH